MKKVLASIGIGNATVDTVLPTDSVVPGETVDAEVHVVGGNADQTVDAVRFEVETRVRTEDGYDDVDVGRLTLTDGFTVEAGAEKTIPATVEIPFHTPVTLGNVDVWVETELDIARAVDPEDRDSLDVRPTPRMRALFDAMERLGFRLHTADCEADPYGRYVSGRRFVQEFEYRPDGGAFAGRLDEVELVLDPGPDALTAYAEVDRRGGLLSELADADESRTELTVTTTDVDRLVDDVEATLERHA
ncbi:sporulation protein [Halobium salinum]|uniref:Sporulation protein n=1 Tax=Halobium salinum TaxID=1364940 RepID=A0ABD5P7M7_9EURY|nr:sporulation protein [Halobium salinum]